MVMPKDRTLLKTVKLRTMVVQSVGASTIGTGTAPRKAAHRISVTLKAQVDLPAPVPTTGNLATTGMLVEGKVGIGRPWQCGVPGPFFC